jgi:ribosome-associated heat shock protein Hsp15
MSTNAAKAGKIKLGETTLKPSSGIEVGQIISVRKNGFNFQFEVLKLIEKRVSATLAAECYENRTPEEEMHKYETWYVGKAQPERRERGAGRPTKKERREIEDFKDEYFAFDEFDED